MLGFRFLGAMVLRCHIRSTNFRAFGIIVDKMVDLHLFAFFNGGNIIFLNCW